LSGVIIVRESLAGSGAKTSVGDTRLHCHLLSDRANGEGWEKGQASDDHDTSATATNGSAFAGLSANTPFYNLTFAAALFGCLRGAFLNADLSPVHPSWPQEPHLPTHLSADCSCAHYSL
jgi:hypothetical protein